METIVMTELQWDWLCQGGDYDSHAQALAMGEILGVLKERRAVRCVKPTPLSYLRFRLGLPGELFDDAALVLVESGTVAPLYDQYPCPHCLPHNGGYATHLSLTEE